MIFCRAFVCSQKKGQRMKTDGREKESANLNLKKKLTLSFKIY